jgi:hypothetical protein
MMGGVSPETCWAIKKHWNNKFYHRIASCWFFLRDLYYDARIHEHQTLNSHPTLGLPHDPFPSPTFVTKMYAFLLCTFHIICPVQLILPNSIILIMFHKQYDYKVPHYTIFPLSLSLLLTEVHIFPMVSLGLFYDLILPTAIWPWCRLSL